MNDVLFQYNAVNPPTWVYLASLLMIGLFFKFGRFWSVRNLDLILLILLAPGLLLVHSGKKQEAEWLRQQNESPDERLTLAPDNQTPTIGEPNGPKISPTGLVQAQEDGEPNGSKGNASGGNADGESVDRIIGANEQFDGPSDEALGPTPPPDPSQHEEASGRGIHRLGYMWLFGVSAIFLVRLLLDPMMVRRPLLEPSLTTGGLTFIGCSLFVFLMANVVNAQVVDDDPETQEESSVSYRKPGPGYQPLEAMPDVTILEPTTKREGQFPILASQIIAILAQLAVVIGIVAVGFKHFDNIKMGIGAATIYLMLPYTAQMTGHVSHVIPAALLVWAIALYRRPVVSGIFLGLAVCNYYTLFLLPLWLSFYWQRGLMRFVIGFASSVLLLILLLIPWATSLSDFWLLVGKMFGVMLPRMEDLGGIWALGWYPFYRIPLLTAFVAFSGMLALWPAQKNLGTLLSCTAAVMVATQFWHGADGATCVGWYLPLMLLTFFRPNLEDRIALTVLSDTWFPRRQDARAAV